jgi:hypothetical protein
MKGYMGKILVVDLGARTCEKEEVPDQVYENLLSGVGLEAWYLCNNIPLGAEPDRFVQNIERPKIARRVRQSILMGDIELEQII